MNLGETHKIPVEERTNSVRVVNVCRSTILFWMGQDALSPCLQANMSIYDPPL